MRTKTKPITDTNIFGSSILVTLCFFTLVLFLSSCDQGQQPSNQTISVSPENSNVAKKIWLINADGDTIPTGKPIVIQGIRIEHDSLKKPEVIRLTKKPSVQSAPSNERIMGPPKITALKTPIRSFTPGEDTFALPKEIEVVGTIQLATQTPAVPALPPHYKDAATHNIQYLDVDRGLLSSYVMSMIEDRQGSLWFGTLEGLSQYDGSTFTHYTVAEGLSHSRVFSLLEDRDGYIWIGTEEGLNRYDGKNFIHYTDKNGLQNIPIWTLLEDSNGDMWIGYRDKGISLYDGRHFYHYGEAQGLGEKPVYCMMQDRQGMLWFGTTGDGIYQFDGKTFHHITSRNGLSHNNVSSIIEDGLGNIWIATDRGVDKYDGKSFEHYNKNQGLLHNKIWSIHEDKKGNLWFGTYGYGVNRFDGKTISYFTTKHGLSDNYIKSIFEDSQRNIWFITAGGANRYSDISFNSYVIDPSDEKQPSVYSILENTDKDLWFSTENGLTKYTKGNHINTSVEQGLTASKIWSMYEDSSRGLWLGTDGAGIYHFNERRILVYGKSQGLNHDVVRCIEKDMNSTMWFGMRGGGLYSFDGNYFTHYSTAQGFNHDVLSCSYLDQKGNLWFGTDGGGLSKFDGQYFTHYTTNEGLSHNTVNCIAEDEEGTLWFGTLGGASRYDGNSFINYTTADGLSHNWIWSIIPDKKQNIWMSTQKGITLFAPLPQDSFENSDSGQKNYIATTFGKKDGLKRWDFEPSGCLDHENTLWFGSKAGLTYLNLDEFTLSSKPLDVRLNNLQIEQTFIEFNKMDDPDYVRNLPFGPQLKKSYDSIAPFQNYPQSLKLPYNLNHLTFHFNAIDWSAPHKIQYKYFMEGYDDSWSLPKAENKADYRNLSYDTYTFKVKAIGRGQNWSEPLEYCFTIDPPWWFTWWARVIYVLIGFLALYGYIQWRTRVHRKKLQTANRLNKRLQQVDKLKDQFLANTSHELRTPLQGIIGLSESLIGKVKDREQKEDLSMIISSGNRLSHLVNDLLDFSKLKNFDIELLRKPINIRVLTDIVLRNNAPTILNKELKLINAVPESLPPAFADENRLQQILFNLIGNAIKFTEKGQIKVSAKLMETTPGDADQMIQIVVEDSGIGIDEGYKESIFNEFEQGDGSSSRTYAGTGLGLSISKQLVELHGGQMWFESIPGKGSTFFFTLPAGSQELKSIVPIPKEINVVQLDDIPEDQPASDGHTFMEGDVRILIVDDERINQRVLKNHLADQGYHITKAMSGREALNAIENNPAYDLVLLDIMMPKMSGFEVCQEIRKKYLPSELPVIMVTAKNQINDIVQGLSYGANDYLPKPFYKEELLARIHTQLDLHRIFDVAGKFVPNEFLSSINRDRITEVKLGDHTEKEVTVLFSDIRDYTTLSETMTPEQNFRFVNAFNSRMVPIIKQHNGFINQFLGDSIMAIFPDDPKDALRAAIAMQHRLTEYNQKRENDGRQPVKMGLGFHTGHLIMGIIGDKTRMDAATISDTVNTASRIESLTKHYGVTILLSQDSLNKMGDTTEFNFRYLGNVQVKGKKDPVGIFECFDGDFKETKLKKKESADNFKTGLDYFFDREFPEAAAVFSRILKSNPDDRTAHLFLNKSSHLTVKGVPDDWTGVEIMKFK